MKHIFIIGSKGIPAKYGGFETFVEKLTEGQKNKEIKYHVACLSDNDNEFEYNGARCFNINVPNIGPAKAVFYDIIALKESVKYIKENNINHAIVYILACRIGPFINRYKKKLKELGAKLFVNPDGHEWKRGKWSLPVKKYWKLSERLMVKHADLLVCDSRNIEKYIQEHYKKYNPATTFIAYGAETKKSELSDDDHNLIKWYKENDIRKKEYYLVVGRFVPENNYETIIAEFIKSKTKKDLVLITNVEKNKFFNTLKDKTHFDKDKRVKFVGTVYNQELLKKIRENAYGYFHGHEVGGTNPSLLEALGSTDLNLLLNVGFNSEVAEDSALYWEKENGDLAKLIEQADALSIENIKELGQKAKKRITEHYIWCHIVKLYENIFLN
jgi:rhamnosyltransferase